MADAAVRVELQAGTVDFPLRVEHGGVLRRGLVVGRQHIVGSRGVCLALAVGLRVPAGECVTRTVERVRDGLHGLVDNTVHRLGFRADGSDVAVVHQVCGVGLPLGPHGGGSRFKRVFVARLQAWVAAFAGAPAGERVAWTVEAVLADGHRVAGVAGGVGCAACGVRPVVAVLDGCRVCLPDGVQVVACWLHHVLADAVLAFAVCGAGTVLGGVPTNERVSVAGETIGVCGQFVTGLAGLCRRVASGCAVAVIGEGLRVTGPAGI